MAHTGFKLGILVIILLSAALGVGKFMGSQSERQVTTQLNDAGACYGTDSAPFQIQMAERSLPFSELPPQVRQNFVRRIASQRQDLLKLVQDGLIMTKLAGAETGHEAAGAGTLESALRDQLDPTADEIKAYYEERKNQFPPRLSFDQLRASIRGMIISERLEQQREQHGAEFKGITLAGMEFCPPKMGGEGLVKPVHGAAQAAWQLTMAGGMDCRECRLLWPKLVALQAGQQEQLALNGVVLHSRANLQRLLNRAQSCVLAQAPEQNQEFVDLMYRAPLQFARDEAKLAAFVRESVVRDRKLDMPAYQACMADDQENDVFSQLQSAARLYGQPTQLSVYVNDRLLLTADDRADTVLAQVQQLLATPN